MTRLVALAALAVAALTVVSTAAPTPAGKQRMAKQCPTVKRTVYSFDGSPHAFYEWLQRESPEA